MWPAVGSTTGPGPTASQPITPLSGCPLTHGASIPPVCNGISRLMLRRGGPFCLSLHWQHGIEIWSLSLIRAIVFCFIEVDTPSPSRALLMRASRLFPKWALSLLGPRLTRAERRPRQGSNSHRRHRPTSPEYNHSHDIRGRAAHLCAVIPLSWEHAGLCTRSMFPHNGPSVQHPHCGTFTV